MKNLLTLLLTLCSLSMFAQTTKGSFMVGGNGSLRFADGDYDLGEVKSTTLSINPTVGYFFIKNFSAGLYVPFELSWSKTKIPSWQQESDGEGRSYGVAPFVRYYIPVKSFFIVTEASYGWHYSKNSYEAFDPNTGTVSDEFSEKYRTFSLAAGPVFFLSHYTSIELLANYQRSNFEQFDQSQFYLSVGFQIYLPSNKE